MGAASEPQAPGRARRRSRRTMLLAIGLSVLLHLALFGFVIEPLAQHPTRPDPPTLRVIEVGLVGPFRTPRAPDPVRRARPADGLPPKTPETTAAPSAVQQPVERPVQGASAAAPQTLAKGGEWRHFFAGDSAGCPREDVALLSPQERLHCLREAPSAGFRPASRLEPQDDALGRDIANTALRGAEPKPVADGCQGAPEDADKAADKWRLKAGCGR